MLQNPVLRQVFEIILSDSQFKKVISDIINKRYKLNTRLRQQLSKENVELNTNIESQILVNFTFQILYSRYRAFLENHNYNNDSYRGLFKDTISNTPSVHSQSARAY